MQYAEAKDVLPRNMRRGVAYHAPVEVEGMILFERPTVIRWAEKTYYVHKATKLPATTGWWANGRESWMVQTKGDLEISVYRTEDGRWFLERVWN